MHAPTHEARKRGRPKAIRSIPAFTIRAYPDMGRREREHHRRCRAERLDDTDAAADENHWRVKIASLALEPYGIQLIPSRPDPHEVVSPGVLHVYRDRPDRRSLSGSVCDGRKLIWRKPTVATLWQIPMPPMAFKLRNRPKIRCAHRSWKSAAQQVAAARQVRPITPRGTDAAAADALLTAIGHLATPTSKRARYYLDRGVNEQIQAQRDSAHAHRLPVYWRAVMSGSGRPRIKLSDWWDQRQRLIGLASTTTSPHLAEHLFEPRSRGYPKVDHDAKAMDRRLMRPRFPPWVSMPSWFTGPLSDLMARLGTAKEWAKLSECEAWWANIGSTSFEADPYEADPAAWLAKPRKEFLYRPGTAPLQRPDVSLDEPFRAAARLWNWQLNNRHREQMRIAWPKFAFHGECTRIDRQTPLSGDVGGQCCRWIAGGFKSCPLQCWSRQK
jgi:hypothetical protein